MLIFSVQSNIITEIFDRILRFWEGKILRREEETEMYGSDGLW